MKKKTILLSVLFVLSVLNAYAVYQRDVPQTLIQPNGDTLHCYASGDEFFNYLHDKAGYTIIQNPVTGYYVYAVQNGDDIAASEYIAGKVAPASVGLTPGILISPEKWRERRKMRLSRLRELEKTKKTGKPSLSRSIAVAGNKPNFTNLVVFIRFKGEPEFTTPLDSIVQVFNNSTTGANSLYNYFQNTSYGQLSVSSTFYPTPNGDKIISYEDTQSIGHFLPGSVNNPIGYNGFTDMMQREYNLVVRAINYLNSNNMIPEDLDLDLHDREGWVDNVCFIINSSHVRGGILWPHNAVSDDVRIGNKGKRVVNYLIMPKKSHKFQLSVLCHEFQHTLTFPDLYHDYSGFGQFPVDIWDLMGYEMENIPQQSTVWAKHRYGKWVEEPKLLLYPGTYTLHSVGSGSRDKIAYKIPSRDPNQFFVLEYRNNANQFDKFENSGVLIYRVDKRFKGNSEYNGTDKLDELYVFRPDGTATDNGSINDALFGVSGRTAFGPETNPYPFLSNGTRVVDDGWSISNITLKGDEATFYFSGVTFPKEFIKTNSTQKTVGLKWELSHNKPVLLLGSDLPITDMPQNGTDYAIGDKLPGGAQVLYAGNNTVYENTGLSPASDYYYKIYSKTADFPAKWSDGVGLIAATECGTVNAYPYFQSFEGSDKLSECYISEGNATWTIEQGASQTVILNGGMQTAHSGIRNAFVQPGRRGTAKLILPTFNLRGATNASLSFWYTNKGKNSVDTDALKVYYRVSPEADWKELSSYHTRTFEWTYAELKLQEFSDTYQIAFESVANDGLGVTLDDIRVDAEGIDMPTAISKPTADVVSVYSQQNRIYIHTVVGMVATVRITDLMGRTVYSGTTVGTSVIDLRVPVGFYIVRLLPEGAAASSHKVYLTVGEG